VRPVALLSDFGLEDHYAGVLHAVLERIAPGVRRIDITHRIPPGDLWRGAYELRAVWRWLPEDAVVLAVVDPGVGGTRRAVACRVGRRWLVAPDNGLAAAAGRPAEAVELDWRRMELPHPSATFHGRDLFAPAAARLARGEAATALGEPVAPTSLLPSPLPEPERHGDEIRGAVLHVDRFGNVITNVPAAWLPEALEARCAGAVIRRRVSTYAEAPEGEVVALVGSGGTLELAMDRRPAAERLGVGPGDAVLVRPLG